MLVWLLVGAGCQPAAPARPTASVAATPPRRVGLKRITLAFGGDVMLGRLVNQVILQRGPRYVWGDVLPLVREADLAL
ncbi:MAG TPA: hypothetical protein EYP49_03040, partial [Anaerolineae bacterium]|nr:hypothetical protein [Anaerolineae bacterium]